MSKKLLILILVILAFAAGGYFFQKKQTKKIHYHAGFQVYAEGKLEDFSAPRFMHIKPCGEDHRSKAEEQLDKAHLHDGVGNVVHIHREGALWKDLLQNLGYKLPEKVMISGYLNGKKVSNILESSINSYDSAVFFIGKVDEKLLKNAVTKEQIMKAEKNTESC